jgi:hypothetical protein
MSTHAEAAAHAQRCARVQAALRETRPGAPLGLSKRTSNLFRDRAEGRKQRLDLRDFHHVIEVDPAAGWVDVEGGASYEELVRATFEIAISEMTGRQERERKRTCWRYSFSALI